MPTRSNNVLAWLKQHGSKKALAEHARYGIVAPKAFGISVGELKKYAKQLGVDQQLAEKLWASGWYEARLLAAFVGDPALVTPKLMDAWSDDFDNWAVVDTACFSLFDRIPDAWKMVPKWAKAKPEFKKRAAFALIWSLSVHDKKAADSAFLEAVKLIETNANDERTYVKKAVSMALRAVGKRNVALHRAAIQTAERLAASKDPTARWIGREALRELRSPGVLRRL